MMWSTTVQITDLHKYKPSGPKQNISSPYKFHKLKIEFLNLQLLKILAILPLQLHNISFYPTYYDFVSSFSNKCNKHGII
jgi:hypothetical protein